MKTSRAQDEKSVEPHEGAKITMLLDLEDILSFISHLFGVPFAILHSHSEIAGFTRVWLVTLNCTLFNYLNIFFSN